MENIVENNKLLAIFLQPSFDGFGTFDYDGCFFKKEDLKFHSDWNWIVEAVNKITCSKAFNDYPDDSYFWDEWNSISIENIFDACVEFVKWYNQQGGN